MERFPLVCVFKLGDTDVPRILDHFEIHVGCNESIASVRAKIEEKCSCVVDYLRVLDGDGTILSPDSTRLTDWGIGAADVIEVYTRDPPDGVGVPSPIMIPIAIIYITSDGRTCRDHLLFDFDATIDNVKAQIHEEIGIDYDFHLVLDGTTLLSEWTLRDYNLEDFDVLTIRQAA
jgi:hypothetical protein